MAEAARDEWAEWEALDNKVGEAVDYDATPTLTEAEEARYGELLDGWGEAREQAAGVVRLLRAVPPEHQDEALRRLLAAMRDVHAELGLAVPLWVGMAQDELDHGDD